MGDRGWCWCGHEWWSHVPDEVRCYGYTDEGQPCACEAFVRVSDQLDLLIQVIEDHARRMAAERARWIINRQADHEAIPGCPIDGCGPAPRPPRSPKADDPILRAVRPLMSVALAEAYHTVGRQTIGRGGAEFCPAWISSEHGERRLCLMPIGHEGPHGTAVTAWVTWSDEAVDRG